ncbi:flippase-like domain-containing protein [bacterium]|nr:flippase-like domain-containing protein [bacterium]
MALLAFLFRSVDPAEIIHAFRGIKGIWLIPAVALTLLSYLMRAVRWRYLLLPLKETSFPNRVSATLIGYMANNLLPARLGELVRAYVLGEREGIGTGAVVATLVIDRLADGFTVLLLLVTVVFTLRLPPGSESAQQGLVAGGYITLGLYLAVVVFLILLQRNTMGTIRLLERLLRPFPVRIAEKIIPFLGAFIDGARITPHWKERLALVATSIFIWVLAFLPIQCVFKAFGLDFPLPVSLFILVLLVFAVMVPASPGYVGTYHAACVYGLLALGVPREMALSVAIVIHGIGFFPVIVVGFICLWRENLSLSALGRRASIQNSHAEGGR